MQYIWPILLVVLSNTFYSVCAKEVPGGIHPLASLTVTYVVGAVFSFAMYYILNRNANILGEYKQLNFAPFLLGIVIVGLEVGYIYAFKAGWQVSTAQIVQAAAVAVFLVFVGFFLYKEPLSWNKLVGIFVCLIGLGLINMK